MTPKCECSNRGCPVHKGVSECSGVATATLYRIDMEDRTGTLMCDDCADDAYDSGLFRMKGCEVFEIDKQDDESDEPARS